MTTEGVLLSLGSIVLFVISLIILAVRAYKKKSKKVPTIMMIVSAIVIVFSFVLNKMYGYAIGIAIPFAFFAFIAISIKSHNNEQKKYNALIDSDPAWGVEKKVRDRLQHISFGRGGSFGFYASHINRDRYEMYLKDNQDVCADFLKDGAVIVATHQIVDPNSLSNNGQALYVYTPNAVFKKSKESDMQSGVETTAVLPIGSMGFGLKGYQGATVVTKKASITGSAVAGAVIGGAAGAIVGAVHATETNANGGKSKVVSDGTISYHIQLFNHWIDCIFISKEILKICPQPPKDYVSKETKTYWIVDRGLAGDKKDLQEILDYLNSIVAKLKMSSDKNK